MKREFLEGLKLDADTIDRVMAENGKDIEREKTKNADRDDLKAQLDKANEALEKVKDFSPEQAKTEIEKYKSELETAKKESAAKIAQMETTARVTDYLSGKKFVNSLTHDAIASKMAESLSGDDSKGKSLDDIFGVLTKDQTNILADDRAPKPPVQGSMTDTSAKTADGVEAAFLKLNPNLKI
jgi:Phage minor structural protein GP20.